MKSGSLLWGMLLIALGGLFLAKNFGVIDFSIYRFSWYVSHLWPVIFLLMAIGFYRGWRGEKKEPGMLFVATIMAVYGVVFLYTTWNDWWPWSYYRLWAFMVIGPGLGFLAMYWFGNREKGLLITAIIVTGVGLVLWTGPGNFRLIWPVAIIIAGILLIRRGKRNQLSGESGGSAEAPIVEAKTDT